MCLFALEMEGKSEVGNGNYFSISKPQVNSVFIFIYAILDLHWISHHTFGVAMW